jgi:hypothetical protein
MINSFLHDANNSDSFIAFQKKLLEKRQVKVNGNRHPMQSAFKCSACFGKGVR